MSEAPPKLDDAAWAVQCAHILRAAIRHAEELSAALEDLRTLILEHAKD